MDNSRQNRLSTAADETTNTMYLSFDAESTLSSTAAFKTMDDTNFGLMDPGEEAMEEKLQDRDKHFFDPLESLEINEAHLTSSLAKQQAPPVSVQPPAPLGIYSTNILRSTFCSTPTKEQLLRSVEVSRGSEMAAVAGGCLNLGLAFQGLDDERQTAYFPRLEENKENAHPENSDASTLSVSSSVEAVNSVIERKMMALSTTEEGEEEVVEEALEHEAAAEITPRSKRSEGGAEKISDDQAISATIKQKRVNKAVPKNTRKSLNEPNLQTNRPSRILANLKKRTSLAATNPKPKPTAPLTSASADGSDEIPKLMNKLLKISEERKIPTSLPNQINTKTASVRANNKRKSLAVGGVGGGGGAAGGNVKPRASMLPVIAAADRRSSITSFKQRMSIVVKTTLNSPARKIPRRSVVMQPNAANGQQARWVGGGGVAAARRSMLPGGKTTSTTKENETGNTAMQLPPKTTVRKSMFPLPDQNMKSLPQYKTKTTAGGDGGVATSKLEATFICSVCACKFRIKSLLDAHKRSHEEDLVAAFVKKSGTGGGSSTAIGNNSTNAQNQCKYCDKKFALERALHIHLMEKCPKIPPAEKRKLHFTEMNHVEKAQLPAFFQSNHVAPHTSAAATTNGIHSSLAKKDAPKIPPKPPSNLNRAAALSSTESLDKKEVTIIAKESATYDSGQSQMGPPQSKIKMKSAHAHAGVYRTPNKNVPCHICKKSFKSIIELINHSDAMHPQSTTQTAAGGGDGVGNGGQF